MKDRGWTLVELTVVLGIAMLVFGMVFTANLTTQRLWKGGFTQIVSQSRGRIVLARIARDIRSSTSATSLNNGDRIQFVTNPNIPPAAGAPLITSEYFVTGSDLRYDPNISVIGDDVTLLNNVFKEGALDFFIVQGGRVVITFNLFNTNPLYGTSWSNMRTAINFRDS